MAWGSSFIPTGKDIADNQAADDWEHPIGKLIRETGDRLIEMLPEPTPEEDSFDSLGKAFDFTNTKISDHPAYQFLQAKGAEAREHTNKVPTHDPYTNPNAIIYYECKCGQILDPGTKRFAELNNCASNVGWKIRFSDSGYVPYCVECGKVVE